MARFSSFLVILLALIVTIATAFVPLDPIRSPVPSSNSLVVTTTTTSLAERKWNFNEGQAPWGLKKNAETWNGRVAQVRGK
jgi:hypothetical protein